MDAEVFSNLSKEEQDAEIVKTVANCLKTFGNEQDRKNVDTVAKMILDYGENLEIDYKQKTQKDITLKIVVKFFDNGKIDAFADIECTAKQKRTKLGITNMSDLYNALGVISISKAKVVIKPKQNAITENLKLDSIKIDF